GRPELFDLFEPGAKDREGLWPQPVNADAGVMLDLAGLDEPALPQHTEVATQKRRAHGKRRPDVAGALWPLPHHPDDATPGPISERGQRVVDVNPRHQGSGFRSRSVNHQWCPSGSTAP